MLSNEVRIAKHLADTEKHGFCKVWKTHQLKSEVFLQYKKCSDLQVTAEDLDLMRDSPSRVLAKIGLRMSLSQALFYMMVFWVHVAVDVGRGMVYQLVLRDTLVLSQSVVIMATVVSLLVGIFITAVNIYVYFTRG